jgi:hypothetical protein
MLRPAGLPIVEPRWRLNVDVSLNFQRIFYGGCGGKVPVKNVSGVQEKKRLYIDGKHGM